MILFKSENNGVLLLLLCEDRYCKPKSSDGKIGLSSLRITFLDEKSKGKQRAKNTPKNTRDTREGFKGSKSFPSLFCCFTKFEIKYTH